MVEWLNKRNLSIATGPITMVMALVTVAIDDYEFGAVLQLVRCFQAMATVSLLFGLLKKDALHKEIFLLVWLLASTFFFSVICGLNITFLFEYVFGRSYDFWDFVTNLLGFCGIVAATALLLTLIYVVYKEYEQLVKDKAAARAAVRPAAAAAEDTKDGLPAYGDLNVTIQN